MTPFGHCPAATTAASVRVAHNAAAAPTPHPSRRAIRKVDATPAVMRQSEAAGEANARRRVLQAKAFAESRRRSRLAIDSSHLESLDVGRRRLWAPPVED